MNININPDPILKANVCWLTKHISQLPHSKLLFDTQISEAFYHLQKTALIKCFGTQFLRRRLKQYVIYYYNWNGNV